MSTENDQNEMESSNQTATVDSSANSIGSDSPNVSINQAVGDNQQPDADIAPIIKDVPTVDGEPGIAGFGIEPVTIEKDPVAEEPSSTQSNDIPLNAEVIKKYSETIKAIDPGFEFTYLPAGDLNEIFNLRETIPNINAEAPKTQEWVEALNSGIVRTPQNNVYLEQLRNKDSKWRQSLKVSDKVELAPGAPSYAPGNFGNILSGEDALRRIHSSIGIGTYLQIPLYSSGFWLTLKAPETDTLLELNRQIADSKIVLGRRTWGNVLANNSVYIVNTMMAFIKNHIFASTISSPNSIEYMDYIKSNDIPTLMWGMACLIWKNGFQYQQACIQSPETCNHVINALLDVSKLNWVDNSALTDLQKIHMSKRSGSVMTLDSIKLYTEQFAFSAAQRFTIGKDKVTGGDIDVELRVPNVTQYINSGMEWVDKIVFFVDKVMADESPETRVIEYLKHAKATRMRQYDYWVSKIHIGEHVIETRDDINRALDIYSNDDKITEAFSDKIRDFITKSTISVFGIPHTACPKCGKSRTTMQGNFSSLIPIDIFATFFTLLAPRVSRIEARDL